MPLIKQILAALIVAPIAALGLCLLLAAWCAHGGGLP